MPPLFPYLVGALEVGFALAGLILLWREVLCPAARARRGTAPLPAWDVPATDFFIFVFLVLTTSFLAAAAAGYAARSAFLGLRGDAVTVFSGAAAQLGMLTGVAVFRFGIERRPLGPRLTQPGVLASGVAAFLVSLPLLIATANAWEFLLKLLGLPVDRQDLIGMFANAKSPWLLIVMITLAVVIAPLNEELVFRAGLFRFLRTRIPRWLALLLPALTFAVLHVNWHTLQGLASLAPLVMLAIVFSLAYERTGRIGTSIVAHACFNLNTILVIFSGLNP
jgi:membrane protease YdiL (CAAX protease family)